jgi:hypothetical protein
MNAEEELRHLAGPFFEALEDPADPARPWAAILLYVAWPSEENRPAAVTAALGVLRSGYGEAARLGRDQ